MSPEYLRNIKFEVKQQLNSGHGFFGNHVRQDKESE